MDNTTSLKAGTVIQNGQMTLTLLALDQTKKSNVVLLICHDDGLFITARNLSVQNNGYTWDWGHYFSELDKALKDYKKRQNEF